MASNRKMGFLVDHCIDAEIARYLSGMRKIKVLSFNDVGLTERSIDPQVLEKATQAGVIVVTGDKRFTETHVPFCTHEGIIKFNMKAATRLRSIKMFMHMSQRHLAWKGITHLYEEQITIHQHNGEKLSVSYRK